MANGNVFHEENPHSEKPIYLRAFTENNSPRNDWGPKKRVNQYGLYAYLNTSTTKTDANLGNENIEL